MNNSDRLNDIDNLLMFCEPWGLVNLPCPNHNNNLTGATSWWYFWNWMQKIERFTRQIEEYGLEEVYLSSDYSQFHSELRSFNFLLQNVHQSLSTLRVLNNVRTLMFTLGVIESRDFTTSVQQTILLTEGVIRRLQQTAQAVTICSRIEFEQSSKLN